MRKHELLNDSERKQLLNIPENRDDLVRLYTFEPLEIDLIRQRREEHNRLGVALQLALLRHPGITMAQMLDSGALPDDLIIFIAGQIGIPVQALSDYGLRGQTMTDHARELALALGMRPAARSDIPMMIEAAASSAWATDKGMPIASGIVEALRQAKIVLPALATIERAGIAGRARARKLATQILVSGLKPAQVEMLDKLFIADPATGISPLAWLKAIPVASKPDNVREIIDRLMFVRRIGIPAQAGSALHPDRYRQFVREGRMSPAYVIERYATLRRRTTVAAFIIDIEERLTDAAIEMADKLIGSMFTRAKNSQARRYVATSKDVSRLMRLFRGTIDALANAVESDSDPLEAIDTSVGWATLLRVRHEVDAIAETADQDPLLVAADRYATLRKFAPALIEALEFKAGRGNTRTLAAIRLLGDLNRSGKRDLPPDAPLPFKKDWQKLVMGSDRKINRRLYEVATLAHLRNSSDREMYGSSAHPHIVALIVIFCQRRQLRRSSQNWSCRHPLTTGWRNAAGNSIGD